MRKILVLLLLCPYMSMGQQQQTIKGIVQTPNGTAVSGAAISSAHTGNIVMSDHNGAFEIKIARVPDTLTIRHVSYHTATHVVVSNAAVQVVLHEGSNELDGTMVIAYGTTTRRMNTGSVGKVSAKDIAVQAVGDPLQTLGGRVTGLTVTQSSGVPGATVKLQIRGRNSIAQGSEPLFIVDGVPFAAGNEAINRLTSVLTGEGAGLSPFSTIAPNDIESIEVLKDADATAIYGSRGANGVVLITTKKGKAGKTTLQVQVSRAVNSITRSMPMLNTQQYVAMRKEAFANDGMAMTNSTAPDILLWDTTRYTNMGETFMGENAVTTDASFTLTGGSGNTQYILGGNYRKEGTVFPGGMYVQRGTGNLGVQHRSANGKLSINASTAYSYNANNLTAGDMGFTLSLPPNFPAFYNDDGSIKWEEGGVALNNPMSYLLRDYTATTQQMNSRVLVSLRPLAGLVLSTSLGYNVLRVDERSVTPIASQNPAGNPLGTLDIAGNRYQGWIAEPQVHYTSKLYGGRLQLLAGATLQDNMNEGLSIKATGYTSDQLLYSLTAAPVVQSKSNSFSKYRYKALFGRVNYSYRDKYIVNFSGRRDGSSRFGTGRQYSNFGAAGAAWLFSKEGFIKGLLPALSYGKLRASYGTSGNDQIGDYKYLDNWGATMPYQGNTALQPQNLFNADYHWEVNRKLEAAIETGFFNDRLLMSVAWYRNRSGNQLVQYLLPTQTGFNSIIRNHDAVVENTGVEVEVHADMIHSKKFEWRTDMNVTIPKNRLLSFKNLEQSSYANAYIIGSSLTATKRYRYEGVNPATGVMQFEDVNKDGLYNVADLQVTGDTDPDLYGGVSQYLRYKQVSLDVFIEFKKQRGRNYLYSLYSGNTVPGMRYNMPEIVLKRWQHPGDVTTIQRFTASSASAAAAAGSRLLASDGIYGDASYVRLKTVAISWAMPAKLLERMHVQQAMLFVRGQNLLTFTKYEGADPETQNLYVLPPMKTFACGISITL